MRWWREFWQPSLKCERVGHEIGEDVRYGFTSPAFPRLHVADSVEQVRQVCDRCGATFSEWETTDRTGLSGLTLNSDRMATLKRDGFVERSR